MSKVNECIKRAENIAKKNNKEVALTLECNQFDNSKDYYYRSTNYLDTDAFKEDYGILVGVISPNGRMRDSL